MTQLLRKRRLPMWCVAILGAVFGSYCAGLSHAGVDCPYGCDTLTIYIAGGATSGCYKLNSGQGVNIYSALADPNKVPQTDMMNKLAKYIAMADTCTTPCNPGTSTPYEAAGGMNWKFKTNVYQSNCVDGPGG